jgi:hypothetical protein
MVINEHIKVGSNSYQKVQTFKYLGSLLSNMNYIHEKINIIIQYKHFCFL